MVYVKDLICFLESFNVLLRSGLIICSPNWTPTKAKENPRNMFATYPSFAI